MSEKHKEKGVEKKEVEEEKNIKFVLNTTEDSTLQEYFFSFGNKYNSWFLSLHKVFAICSRS